MMKKRTFFRRSILSLLGLSTISLTAKAMAKGRYIDGKFIHMVFFWLREDADVKEFVRGTENFLNQVKEVNSYHLGTPAMTPREVVDNSYSVSLVVTFDSKEDQDAYQKHPAHLRYIEENSMKWTVVKIFDSWSALDK